MRRSSAICCRSRAWGRSALRVAVRNRGAPSARMRRSRSTSRHSPGSSRSSTATARTTRSTGPRTMRSGADPPTVLARPPAQPDGTRPRRHPRGRHAHLRAQSASRTGHRKPETIPGTGTCGCSGVWSPREPAARHSGQRRDPRELADDRLPRGAARRPGVTDEDRERHLAGARRQSLSMLYWLREQRPPARRGHRVARAAPRRGDIVAAGRRPREGGVRESPSHPCRHDGGRAGPVTRRAGRARRRRLPSVGIGVLRIDLHPLQRRRQLPRRPPPPSRSRSARCCPSRGEPRRGRKEHRHDAHHERLLWATTRSNGTSARRPRRTRRALPGERARAARGSAAPDRIADFQRRLSRQTASNWPGPW